MRHLFLAFLMATASIAVGMSPRLNWDKAIEDVIIKYSFNSESEVIKYFSLAHVVYPPSEIALLAFKQEKRIELWAKIQDKRWQFIHTYPLTAFSGHLGPKLKESDGQIPEGIYRLTTFNPFSSMHLSMMLDYPNYFDRLQAGREGRRRLGNNIFLHGKSSSAGCLAVGDKAIEQLFLLAYRVGLKHTKIIIAPNDLRKRKPATLKFAQHRWLPELYKQIKIALKEFPKPQHERS